MKLISSVALFTVLAILPTSTRAQHSTCVTERSGSLTYTKCHAGGYSFPGNFDVSKLHTELASLWITGMANVAAADSTPLPNRWSLKSVQFTQFNQFANHPRFPLAQMLSLNKHIESITLHYVKLQSLTANDVKLFTELKVFSIYGGEIAAVSLDTFAGLGKLQELDIAGNHELRSLDWAFLQPVSKTVQRVGVYSNGLTAGSLTRSSPFTLVSAKSINLAGNKLGRVSASVYDTLNVALKLELHLYRIDMCPDSPQCGCCEMQEFAQWMKENKQTGAITYITCGGDLDSATNSTAFMAIPGLFDHCKAVGTSPKPTNSPTQAPPVVTPSVTCPPSAPDSPKNPITVTCAKNKITVPVVELQDVETSGAEFVGDQTRKCVDAAYGLHQWLVGKTGQAKQSFSTSDASVVANCVGRGIVTLNENDPDAAMFSAVTVNAAFSKKCSEFFFEFVEKLLALK